MGVIPSVFHLQIVSSWFEVWHLPLESAAVNTPKSKVPTVKQAIIELKNKQTHQRDKDIRCGYIEYYYIPKKKVRTGTKC